MDLVTIEIMRELATLNGERNVDGTWKSDKVSVIEANLARAGRLQMRVESKLAKNAAAAEAKASESGSGAGK
jgi:hypothetical protein